MIQSSRLDLPDDVLTELGGTVLSAVLQHLKSENGIGQILTREDADKMFAEDAPNGPSNAFEVFDTLIREVAQAALALDHPRMFAWVPGPSNPIGALADMLATGFNLFGGSWVEGSGPTEIELTTLRWLRDIIGMPEGTDGVFVSGGSVGNLTALGVARDQKSGWRNGIVYTSDQTHVSVRKACHVLGLEDRQYKLIPSNGQFQIDTAMLRAAMSRDASAGRPAIAVVGNAGTTNTGTVDPLNELADLAKRYGAWFHIDGSFGAPAALDQQAKQLMAGIERADSVTLDPHKWLFQPYECGVLLCRDGAKLEKSYHSRADYLKAYDSISDAPNMCDRSMQLSRGTPALKLWATIKVFGLDAFSSAIRRGIELAEYAENAISTHEQWEITSHAQLAVVTFRNKKGDDATKLAVDRASATGEMMVGTTVLYGNTVARMCTINPRTTTQDIDLVIDTITSRKALTRSSLNGAT